MIAWGLLALALAGWFLHVAALRARLARREPREGGNRSRPDAACETWFDKLGEAVLRIDAQGRVLAANPAARRVLGIREGGARPGSPLPMLAVYRDPDWIEALHKALAGLDAPHALPPMEAGGRVLAPRLAPLGNGEALMLCLDITREQRLERQRRDFLANLMHDLKTPLTSLLGYARSLASFGEDADFRREAIEVIGAEARRVNDLLEALLELEAIGCEPAGRDARADAAAALEEIARAKAARAEERGCAIHAEARDAPLYAAIAPRDLARILENLVENALKHGRPVERGAKGNIALSCRRRGRMAEIEVADEGPGIPEKHLRRVTERFYRVDGARVSGESGGHGLGLAIVRETVERAGGRLLLENREPRGLRALVRLPLADEG